MAKKKSDSELESAGEKIEVKSAPQVNDVAKPGSIAASPTSRPIITSHVGMIKQDPMVAGHDSEPEEKTAKKSEIKLEPISEEKKPETEEKTPEEPDKTEEEKESTKPLEENQSEDEEKKDDSTSSDSAAIDSLASAAESKKVLAKEEEVEQAKEAKIEELINSKKYNVSIVEGGHKATSQKIISWVLLLLLLAAVGAYLAVDAGYLDIGIDLPYDLIKN